MVNIRKCTLKTLTLEHPRKISKILPQSHRVALTTGEALQSTDPNHPTNRRAMNNGPKDFCKNINNAVMF